MISIERYKTFVAGLDSLIEGGFPKGHVILLVGTPGTGKSIFCSQVLFHNAVAGKSCLFLNMEQNSHRTENQMAQFGWDLRAAKSLKILSIDADDPNLVTYLLNELQQSKYDLVCLDSLDSITSNPIQLTSLPMHSDVQRIPLDPLNLSRLRLKTIFKALANSGATVLLTSERVENQPGLTRDTISEFLCDGIILLKLSSLGLSMNRTLQILKMRETKIDLTGHVYEIAEKGIQLR